jgi:acetyltransferase-like isoleucine patch superfamily enzyme
MIKKLFRRTYDDSKDKNVVISNKCISVGRFTYGYEKIHILSWGEESNITIGRFCSISSGLKLFCGGNHRIDWISTFPFGHVYESLLKLRPVQGHPNSNGDIHIGNDVWIGRDVTILSGITVGDGAVIAANSHVVSNVDPYTVWGGNPANKITQRFSDEVIRRLLIIKWWNYPTAVIESIVPFLCDQNGAGISENLDRIEQILHKISL